MRCMDEHNEPGSCLNRAHPAEMIFVLLGRDEAASNAIRAWCAERVRLGKNKDSDPEIREAYSCAATMDEERAMIRKTLGKV